MKRSLHSYMKFSEDSKTLSAMRSFNSEINIDSWADNEIGMRKHAICMCIIEEANVWANQCLQQHHSHLATCLVFCLSKTNCVIRGRVFVFCCTRKGFCGCLCQPVRTSLVLFPTKSLVRLQEAYVKKNYRRGF